MDARAKALKEAVAADGGHMMIARPAAPTLDCASGRRAAERVC